MTKCLHNYIAKEVGCSLNWFENDDYPVCSTKEEIERNQNLHAFIGKASWENLSDVTGCRKKCTTIKYETTIASNEDIHWTRLWISEVFIQPAGDLKEEVIEYLTYDFMDMLGDVGGYLGLFLGWSLLSMGLYVRTGFGQITSDI